MIQPTLLVVVPNGCTMLSYRFHLCDRRSLIVVVPNGCTMLSYNMETLFIIGGLMS